MRETAWAMEWPDGRDFAFTIFDDTDFAELTKLREIYAFLTDMGLRTTKTIWPLRGREHPEIGGATCEEPDYLRWVLALQQRGFEIALHNVAYSTSTRDQTILGFDRFRELFGHDPRTLANHAGCRESIYWGEFRLTGAHRLFYNILTRFKRRGAYSGHIETSELFWGDICRQRVGYVRNFVYEHINTLKMCPEMPYRDPSRPFVNAWFAASEGPRVELFTKTCSEANLDLLQAEGGACIMYTHFGQDFHDGRRLHSRFQNLMRRLSRMNGWFVPVHVLLDFLAEHHGGITELTSWQRRRLELRWLWDRSRFLGRV